MWIHPKFDFDEMLLVHDIIARNYDWKIQILPKYEIKLFCL